MVGPLLRTCRWLVRGLGAELLENARGREPSPPHEARHDGETAVVTGATGGIGREVCLGLADCGFDVVVAARDPARGQALVAEIHARGGKAEYEPLELNASAERVSACGRRLGSSRQPVSLLVNNAGAMGVSKAETMRVNFLSPVVLTLALLPALLAAPRCRIVNVGSSSHLRAAAVARAACDSPALDRDLSAYAASKLGLMHFGVLLRAEYNGSLCVHDCHPGLVWTPMLRRQLGVLAPALSRIGLRPVLFKNPSAGAATVLAAALNEPQSGSAYFVNGALASRGASSTESSNAESARRTWRGVITPLLGESLPMWATRGP